ncbi:MAG: ATP-dependent helicase HrpB [Phycisphaerae bacterium]
MPAALTPLPIDGHLPQVLAALQAHGAAVLVAEPGAGKTTRVPPAVWHSGMLPPGHDAVVVLQPRRVAARASATRIAQEQHVTLGQEVGYHVRFDRRLSSDTKVRVLTEGVLNRQILGDPELAGVGCVILDEFHERSIHADMAVALLKEVRQALRPDLKLLVMSATLDAGPVAAFLGDCPVLNVPGRTYPVTVTYAGSRPQDDLADRIARELSARLPETPGHVLVFLPGVGEINRTLAACTPLANREDLFLLPLHGSLPLEEQVRALEPSRRQKVICATNIAETSLTIEGVTLVIDSGLARVAAYDAGRGVDRLGLESISRASAEQRAGRAGRTAPGHCVRLWSQMEHAKLKPFDEPEIRRVDLAPILLDLANWGQQPDRFAWFEPPAEVALLRAADLLQDLGATRDGCITPLGKTLSRWPIHPRLGRLLLAAGEAGLHEAGAQLAAMLEERDLLPAEAAGTTLTDSDLLWRLDLLQKQDRRLDPGVVQRVRRIAEQLRPAGSSQGRPAASGGRSRTPAGEEAALLRATLLAYPDRVCRRRESDPDAALMVGGVGVRLGRASGVRRGELFVAVETRDDPDRPGREAVVNLASRIEEPWLAELFPGSVKRVVTAEYDSARGRVVGVGRLMYRDLPLRESTDAAVPPAEAADALKRQFLPEAEALLAGEPALCALLSRLQAVDALLPVHLRPAEAVPAADAPAVVAAACDAAARANQPTGQEVRRRLNDAALADLYASPWYRLLEEHAPTEVQVPTGSRIKLDWTPADATATPPRGPVLAVRLQELFGLAKTPAVCGGVLRVTLHLLGPNHRPVQVTDDLPGFWQRTYPQVRKDLRARYPKHSWPEDPLAAEAVRGVRRRER